MRKLIAKLPSNHLKEEADKSGLPFFTPVGFTKESLRPNHFSSPEAYPAKEYPGLLPAVLNHYIYIRGIHSEINICSRVFSPAARCTEEAYFFSYREPANSIHINRNRFTNIKSKTFT